MPTAYVTVREVHEQIVRIHTEEGEDLQSVKDRVADGEGEYYPRTEYSRTLDSDAWTVEIRPDDVGPEPRIRLEIAVLAKKGHWWVETVEIDGQLDPEGLSESTLHSLLPEGVRQRTDISKVTLLGWEHVEDEEQDDG